MPRQIANAANPEEARPDQYLEVPLIVYAGGRRIRVGMASVFGDGIAAHFDEHPDDGIAKTIIEAITRGAVNALSIAPTPDRDPCLADYINKE